MTFWDKPISLTDKQRRLINRIFTVTVVGTFLSLLGMVLYYAVSFAAQANGSSAHSWLLGIFSDFVAIMDASLMDSPYIGGDYSYPPLAIALLYPFAMICRGAFARYSGLSLTVDELTSRIIQHPEFWIAFVLFFAICSLAITLLALTKYRFDRKNSLKLGLTALLSTPFVYAVMRGNTVYFALIFLLLFLLLYEHKSPVLRELSYLCLALAGMIKIYPLFFGVYLLCRKKWFACLRVGLYFAVGSLLSFFLYQGGLDNISLFLSHLSDFANAGDRLTSGKNLSLSSLLAKLISALSPQGFEKSAFDAIQYTAMGLFLLLSAITASITKSSLSRAVIASAVVALIPPVSYFYVLIFLLIPFLEFVRSYENIPKPKQRLYTALFCFLFFSPTILAQQYILHTVAIILMSAIEIKDVLQKKRLQKKKV